MTDPSALFDLAQIAVALGGFSAVVIVLRRTDSGKWRRADADRFHGMIVHAVAAAFFSLLPSAIEIFVDRPATIWKVASGIFAVQILWHMIVVWRLPSTTRPVARILTLVFLVPLALQLANVLGFVFDGEFLPYLAGILFHLFQASFLFVLLIWIREKDIEE